MQNVKVKTYRRGRLVRVDHARNHFVSGGLDAVAELAGEQNHPVEWIGLGTHDTAVSPQDSALGNEVYRNAVTRRVEYDNFIRFQLLLLATQGLGHTFYEAGLFTGARRRLFSTEAEGYETMIGTGIMLARCVLVPITPDGVDTFVLTWDVPIQSA